MSIELWAGLLATVVSCAALVAVVISVRLQSREIRDAREQGARANQLHLVTVLMENPHLRIEAHATQAEILEYQRRLYVNLLIKHLESDYLTGVLSEPGVQAQAALLFQRLAMPEFWAEFRYLFEIEARGDRRRERFVAILDEQFRLSGKLRAPEAGNGPADTGL